MKKVYISKINYFDGENTQNFAYCIFDDKEQATEWIKHHRNMLEEDLYLFKKMEQVFCSTLSEEERNKYYLNLSDLARSFEEYYISPLGFDIAIDEYSYEIDEYEIGKEGIVESYYDFGKPVIDVQRVEQKLDAYKKERGDITNEEYLEECNKESNHTVGDDPCKDCTNRTCEWSTCSYSNN